MANKKIVPPETSLDQPVDPVSAAPPSNPSEMLQEITKRRIQAPTDRNVLVNIPVWGWTGDGKTCAILTALHYCEPPEYPLGFALVTDTDELAKLEAKAEAYRGLDLVSTARATTARLQALSKTFIDDNEWPAGTDEPSPYVLAIRSASSTHGYAILPDLRGGSYRELDDAAKAVLGAAHACVLLVNPELYEARTTDAKRYRDEITARVQAFAEAKVPLCVMITKADRTPGPDKTVDSVHRRLSALISSQQGIRATIHRVSVVGCEKKLLDDKRLPSASERSPRELIAAWVWTVDQALQKPAQEIRECLPNLRLRSPVIHAPQDVNYVPELRQLGDFSDCPGTLLCSTSDEERNITFLFIAETGEVTEVTMPPDAIEEPKTASFGTASAWVPAARDLQAHFVAGELILGTRRSANALWQGSKGSVIRTTLPYELATWAPLTSRRVVGVDSSGRIHSFQRQGEKWTQVDFIESFVTPTPITTCAAIDGTQQVFVLNGTSAEGVLVGADGRFGSRVKSNLACKFDKDGALLNSAGMFAGINGEAVGLSCSQKVVDAGPARGGLRTSIAAAARRRTLAIVAPDLRLTALSLVGDEIKRTAASHSPTIPETYSSMAWTPSATMLVVTTADKTWSTFRPFGIQER